MLRMMCNQEAEIESWTAQLHFVCMRDGGVDDSYRIEDTGKRQNARRRRGASTTGIPHQIPSAENCERQSGGGVVGWKRGKL